MAIDLTSLKKALASLDRAIEKAQKTPDDEEYRDAVIQRFEYTYELSWKSLKRVLEAEAPSPEEVDGLSFKDLIRRGAERGIILEPEEWSSFRENRSITSHIYDEGKAASVYASALRFAKAARRLLARLEGRQS